MSILQTVSEDDATGDVAASYDNDRQLFGHVSAHTRVMTLNPEAEHAFEALVHAIKPSIGSRNYRLITLAAAGALGSQPCRVAHGLFARNEFDDDQLERIARDHRDAGLSAAEVAMMDFAVKLSTDSAAMTDADAQGLRDHGFTDRQILDITLAAAARNYYSRALNALAVVDPVPHALPDRVRDALLDGI